MLRRTPPAVRAEIALYGPRRAAVLLHPAPGRWPRDERADRLALGVSAAVLGSAGADERGWPAYRDALAALAGRLAAADAGPLPGDLVPLERFGAHGILAVVPWEGEGRARAEVHLLATRGGPVPRAGERPREAGPAFEVCSLALLVALAADAGEDRLALALGVEGVLAWFRESDRMSAPRNGLAFALVHAGARLAEAGRPPPPGL